MIYLSGVVKQELPAMGAGYLLQPNMGNRPNMDGVTWATQLRSLRKTG